ncbi:phosphatidylinositol-4-phosphate 5-kinase-like protein 1 [Thoreauomyces humboldtii]|nr:phosphatidylinositol-4-phosphate 5-kinase-like protein 1 [Thoreauomyces humboldtii]
MSSLPPVDPAAAAAASADSIAQETLRVNIIFILTATFSILGAMTVIRSYLVRRELRTPSLHIVAVMAACDLVFAIKFVGSSLLSLLGNTQPVTTGTFLCGLSGHLGQFFALSTILWNGVISLNLFFLLYKPRKHKPGQWLKTYHYVVWGYCVASAIILASAKQIGFTEDGTCWIVGKRSPYRLLFYIPLFLSFIFAIFAVSFATYRLRVSNRNTAGASTTRKVLTRKRASLVRIYLVTIIFVLVWMWSIIFRATAFANDDPSPVWLVYTQAFFLGSQGFFNAAAWSVSVLFAPHRSAKDRYKPHHIHVSGAPPRPRYPEPDSNTVARFQVLYPGTADALRKESWEHLEPEKWELEDGAPSLPSNVVDTATVAPVPDSVWRIAVRAAAGSPTLDRPAVNPNATNHDPNASYVTITAVPPAASVSTVSVVPVRSVKGNNNKQHMHHTRARSSFYDFYELVVFDREAASNYPIKSWEFDETTSSSDATLRDDEEEGHGQSRGHGWRYGTPWSARREWAGHA